MRVLVTGSTGFVGQALVPYLIQNNIDVISLDRSQVGDFTNVTSWLSYLEGVDTVIHLAGRAHRMEDEPTTSRNLYFQENVDVTRSLAKDAQKAGVKQFIYLSSVKACGEGKNGAYVEDDQCTPFDPYGQSKLEAEKVLEALSVEGEMNIVIIRPPLIYGPGVKANFKALLSIASKPIPLPFSGFRAKRSLLYVGNLIHFINHLIHKKTVKKYDLIFLSDGVDYSLPQMLGQMYQSLGRKDRLFYVPPFLLKWLLTLIGKKNIYQRLNGELTISCLKAQNDYEWKPPYSFTDGIRAIYEKSV